MTHLYLLTYSLLWSWQSRITVMLRTPPDCGERARLGEPSDTTAPTPPFLAPLLLPPSPPIVIPIVVPAGAVLLQHRPPTDTTSSCATALRGCQHGRGLSPDASPPVPPIPSIPSPGRAGGPPRRLAEAAGAAGVAGVAGAGRAAAGATGSDAADPLLL